MKFVFPKIVENKLTTMRRLGYHPHPKNESFIRRLGSNQFPRFHIYTKDTDQGMEAALHLDQKGVCYHGQTAHSGDYEDNQALDQEKQRIINFLSK
ncbi:hypothetical protein C0580_02180 [Candidatus Parcubacteria bacterium]|nr:MAG: hypothetical protein C0580_02180 [Candidatus Parcubacteria bacterium]